MNCILCDRDDLEHIEYRTRKSNRSYYLCKYCDLIFLDRKFMITDIEEKNRYLMHNNTGQNEGYTEMFNIFLSKVETVISLNDKMVLDYGCGPNPVLQSIIKNRYKKTIVDIYDPYFYPVPPSAKYDVIVSTEVFEHFNDVKRSFESVISLLNNGGYLSVMTNFHHSNMEDFKKWWYISDKTHISFFNYKTMEFLSSMYALEIVYTDSVNTIIFKKI